MLFNGAAFNAAPLNGARYQRVVAATAALASSVSVSASAIDDQRAIAALVSAVEVSASATLARSAAAAISSAATVTANGLGIFAGVVDVETGSDVHSDSTLTQAGLVDIETSANVVAYILHYVQSSANISSGAALVALAGASLGRANLASGVAVSATGTQVQLAQATAASACEIDFVGNVWITRYVNAALNSAVFAQADAGINGHYAGFVNIASAVDVEVNNLAVAIKQTLADFESGASVTAVAAQAYAGAAAMASAAELDDGAVRIAYFTGVIQSAVDVEPVATRWVNGAVSAAAGIVVSPAPRVRLSGASSPASAIVVVATATDVQPGAVGIASAVTVNPPFSYALRYVQATLATACEIAATAVLDANRKDPAERTMQRPFNDRVMVRPFNDRVMYHPPVE